MRFTTNNKIKQSLLAIACLLPLSIQSAQALSSFNSSAAVTYTLNSINNLTNSGSVAGLTITGAYDLDAFSTSEFFTGDGTASASPLATGPNVLTAVAGSSFTETMLASGNAGIGSVDAFYLGLFGLNFDNTSTDTFQISVQLDYALSTNSNGENAASDIILDYYNELDDFGGFDSVAAATPFTLSDSSSANPSVIYSFTLNGNSFDALYVDAAFSGTLISTTPVPVPAALWLFGSALCSLPLSKKLKRT